MSISMLKFMPELVFSDCSGLYHLTGTHQSTVRGLTGMCASDIMETGAGRNTVRWCKMDQKKNR